MSHEDSVVIKYRWVRIVSAGKRVCFMCPRFKSRSGYSKGSYLALSAVEMVWQLTSIWRPRSAKKVGEQTKTVSHSFISYKKINMFNYQVRENSEQQTARVRDANIKSDATTQILQPVALPTLKNITLCNNDQKCTPFHQCDLIKGKSTFLAIITRGKTLKKGVFLGFLWVKDVCLWELVPSLQ